MGSHIGEELKVTYEIDEPYVRPYLYEEIEISIRNPNNKEDGPEKTEIWKILNYILNAAKCDVDDSTISAVRQECLSEHSRITLFISSLEAFKERLIEKLSLLAGKKCDQVSHVNCPSDCFFKSKNYQRISESKYNVSLKAANQLTNVEAVAAFRCSPEELRDLVLTFDDIKNYLATHPK